ncbi:protein transport protein SEC16B homolog isoform X1 [Juglans microcarpa x Juglans regia]|uniref:protein transport protein SEC16B homolog isoform X1 n=1 Tax=Juglans microcarpa x Juglans regia TaxID=2249226 RepID=UPI001B7E975F|nr:protein transport protein SEC16B homolog isoform X1 [Juglans microcarpa x Juglans regia]XP_040991419.1 protein transport protein SEC16B homolog isoform X1 [Juglans microcarpa x Juglans regia]XP_040991420.1 protein transport protein SEC16B homolog isoform X1 [Juglans microcarpa x Juglans regia]
MASSPFEEEDQTDEDFFDRLVNDEIDFTGLGPSVLKNDGLEEAKVFSNLSMAEVGSAAVDSGGNAGFEVNGEVAREDMVLSASLEVNEDNLASKESNSLIPENRNESNNMVAKESISSLSSNRNEVSEGGIEEECALDSTVGTNSVAAGAGMKEVQWSSFGSNNDVGGAGFGSYSDFFSELGNSSEDPFASVANMGKSKMESNVVHDVLENPVANLGASGYEQPHEGQYLGVGTGQNLDGQDSRSSDYWESLYPGWKYDANTGQWYQLGGNDANTNADINVNANAHAMSNEVLLDQTAYYQLQTAQAQSVAGTAAEGCTAGSVSHWNQTSLGNMHYPVHMVFDPQYPGWYYDTITGEWKLLESYIPASNQLTSIDDNQQFLNQNVENHGSQSLVDEDGSAIHYNQQVLNTWQTQDVAKSDARGFTENRKSGDHYSLISHLTNSTDQQSRFNPDGSFAQFEQPNWNVDGSNKFSGFQGFIPGDNSAQQQSQTKKELNQHMHFSPAHFDSQKSVNFSQHLLHSGTQFSHTSNEARSSEGRPPHALVTFGFGGKLVFMKCNSPFHTNSYGSQDSVGGAINILNLMEVVVDQTNPSNFGWGAHDYFHALCHQSFPGPLVGGNFGNKELNKWIDEKISECESSHVDYKKGEVLRLLFSLLKIACQYYGKLRSPFGTHQVLKESDCPESAVAKLFAFSKRKGEYGALAHCLQNLPSEAQIQASAREVQNLLVSGRKKDALQCAQEGQLWGLALVLSSQLGDQVYGETVKKMALSQFIVGTPLQTLCLLAAGQPADVFSSASTWSSLPSSVDKPQQPAKIGANRMLDEWEENLAIMTANRTKNDELVIIHLGDCLWKEHGEATAAHICYLVAEANVEPYTDSARLCLIGADHWKFPRTYASPEAVQRTELYEYSKVLGNSQFLLLPFQPYKLIYAHMLAEVGKIADALKYCQAILKSLKTSRAPEVDMWRQLVLSLEERIRTHQQGGYGTDLAPTKLGKLLTFFDSTAHRVVGGLPPPVPSTSHSSSQQNELAHQPGGLEVSSSQATMAMSTLMPSVSMEPINEQTGESKTPNRSISEPDFGRSPKKVDSSQETKSSAMQPKASTSGGSSRFGHFGSQLLQKTVGLVLRSRPDRQAKLGEKNRFYFDEKLKRWVEEGAEPPIEESVLPPPPTAGAFQNVMQDYNMKDAAKAEVCPSDAGQQTKSLVSSEQGSEIPPMPCSSNQFTARGRIGVRSRYVDTFNKGGGTSSNFFLTPSIAAAKPGGGSNPKFFIPSPAASVEGTVQTPEESVQEATMGDENPPSFKEDLFSSQQTSTSLQRFPSLDNIVQKRGPMAISNSLFPPPSRRAASWSGSLCDARNPSMINEIKHSGEALAVLPALNQPGDPSSMQFSTDRNSSADDLHEVEL